MKTIELPSTTANLTYVICSPDTVTGFEISSDPRCNDLTLFWADGTQYRYECASIRDFNRLLDIACDLVNS